MAVSALMVDTSAYAAFKRGLPEAVSALQRAAAILLPVIVLGELLASFEAGSHRRRYREELRLFLANARVDLTPVDEATAERYGVIYLYLRRQGRPAPTNDLWIAASAMTAGAELLTLDAQFLHMPQIIVRHIGPGLTAAP